MRFEYTIRPRRVALILAAIALYLALQSIIAEYVIDLVPDVGSNWQVLLAIDLFSVNRELTIPTWYSVALLLFSAVLLALIAAAKYKSRDRYTLYWVGLAAIFLYLALDEGAAIHEIAADIIKAELNPTGFLSFGWQIVFAPLLLIFVLVYGRFLLHLSPRTRSLFILSGAVYVGGALVIESVSANQYYLDSGASLLYLAIATVEELWEMLGAVLLIYTLLSHMVEMDYGFAFHPRALGADAVRSETPPSPVDARAGLLRRLVIVPLVLVVGMNLLLLSWAWGQDTAPGQIIAGQSAASVMDAIEQVLTPDVQVTRLIGRFGVDNLASRQTAAALLGIYEQVMVVTAYPMNSSIVLAGDALPFDPDSLADALRADGITQFLILDTAAVRAVAGSLETGVQTP